jgi:heme-degrading monooxygenase HmoA
MAYVRISIVKPRRGEEAHAEEIIRKLAALSADSAGCQSSQVLKPRDDSGEIARIVVYDTEASAEAIANSTTMLSLRSELHLLIEPGHVERAFFTV